MSATIILIMTSSSTRNTEPPGGCVAIINGVLAHPGTEGAQIMAPGAISTYANRSRIACFGLRFGSRLDRAGPLTPKCILGSRRGTPIRAEILSRPVPRHEHGLN